MSLRGGRIRSQSEIIKKPYRRRQRVEQTEPSDEEQRLVLEESIEKINELEQTLDEYGRVVPKDNVDYYAELDKETNQKGCLTEEEVAEEKQVNKRGKKNAFRPIDDRDHCFASEEEIDTYIRLREQFDLKITNNNMVKCSYIGCLKSERHEMVCKYLKCECKQVNCTLKYQYRHCDSLDEWQLFREGIFIN